MTARLQYNGLSLADALANVRRKIEAVCDLHRAAQDHWLIEDYVERLEREAALLLLATSIRQAPCLAAPQPFRNLPVWTPDSAISERWSLSS